MGYEVAPVIWEKPSKEYAEPCSRPTLVQDLPPPLGRRPEIWES